jgi:hypothetical protein
MEGLSDPHRFVGKESCMPRMRQGIEIPIIPEDFIISDRKPRPHPQPSLRARAKRRASKFGLESSGLHASGKKGNS